MKNSYLNISGIYFIQSKTKQDRVYIGSAINIRCRWNQHKRALDKGCHHSRKLQRHYNKYGLDDLDFILVKECDKEELLKLEQLYLDSNSHYFNILDIAGSQLGAKRSIESCNRMSESGKKRPPKSMETRRKISEYWKGKKRPWNCRKQSQETIKKRNKKLIGQKRSEETKKRISTKLLGHAPTYFGRKHTDETKQKISKSLTGLKASDNTKLKMRLSAINSNNSGRFLPGYKMSEDTLNKIIISNRMRPRDNKGHFVKTAIQ